MKRKLIIIGAGGHGKVVADTAWQMKHFKDICFLDDDEGVSECGGFPVVGKSREAEAYIEEADLFVAVGNPGRRQCIQERLHKMGAALPVLCHPKAVVGSGVQLGEGTVVMAGAVINPGSTVGKGCIINTCASLDHDCQVKDYVHVSVGAHLAGAVQVEERTWIGIGAAVRNNVTVSRDCVVGAGAVVVKDIGKPGIYIGVPAKEMPGKDRGTIFKGGGNPVRFPEKRPAIRQSGWRFLCLCPRGGVGHEV